MQSNKIIRFLNNKQDREKYKIDDFPDNNFIGLFTNAAKLEQKDKMIKKYSSLTKYIIEKMGGFDIDGWKMRTPVEL